MSQPRMRILCVDDEPLLLEGLTLHLRRHYEVCTATSGPAALDLLATDQEFAVIVSDMRMPIMDGAAFLERAREIAPDARRILLTGQTDMAGAIAAVNKGQIFRFLTKPCPQPELLAALNAAAEDYKSVFLERSAIRRNTEERVAGVDRLTGLPSREGLLRWFEQTVRGDVTNAPPFLAVYVVGIDGFKEHDDPAHPERGERVIAEVAQRLRICCPEAMHLARWSDDRFVVVTVAGTSDGEGLQFNASDLISRLMTVPPADGAAPLSFSLGAARWPADSEPPRSLIGFAEMAMDEARALGGGTACVFKHEWQTRAEKRRSLLAALRQAIERDELHLHYQPIINLPEDTVHSLECLARWEHPQFGNIPPSVFITLAEESGLIARLGEWILRRACLEGGELLRNRSMRLAVNISVPQMMQLDFIPQLDATLAATGFDPNRLELELTESVFANDIERVTVVLAELRERGVRIAIDDFGTGYSSLSYLNQLPVSLIKVDRSFVRSFGSGGEAIISAAVGIARSRNISVVVEGVETSPMLQRLRQLDVQFGQGFLFARPMDVSGIREWLQRMYPLEAQPEDNEAAGAA